MKILHVTPYYAPAWAWGGVVASVTGLSRAQQRAGHRVRVLTTDTLGPGQRGPAGAEDLDGIEVWRVPTRGTFLRARLNLSWPRDFSGVFGELTGRENVDVVHCHELRTVETVMAVTAAVRAGIPAVLSPHGTLTYTTGQAVLKRGWDALLSRRTLARFRHVIALTAFEADDVRALWAANGIEIGDGVSVVPSGVDLATVVEPGERLAARGRLGIGADDRVVLFLGRLHERKRVHLLLEAFAIFSNRCEAARLILAGPDGGELASVRAAIPALGLTGRVLLPGLVTGAARREVLAAADVFALVARGEGLPMAALEALAAGVPAVLSEGCHLPEVAAAGAGLVVEDSPAAVASALARIALAPDEGAEMSRRARQLVSARFAWPAIVAQLDEAYSRAADRGDRRRPDV